MEKETKRALQNILEILREQEGTISTLRSRVTRSRESENGLAVRIARVADEVSERQSYEFDWHRLCDRHYTKKS